MPPSLALPIHGMVQLTSNITRVWLLWHYLNWGLILRFSLLMPLGVWAGLTIFQYLPPPILKILIGFFVLMSLFTHYLKSNTIPDIANWVFIPLGAVTGAMNMLVGNLGPILATLMLRKSFNKEVKVGTLGFFGLIGNFLKVVGFTMVGFQFLDHWMLVVMMIPSGILGTFLGRKLLAEIDEGYFKRIFQWMLACFAIKLIIFDGFILIL